MLRIQTALAGNVSAGQLSYDQISDHVRNTAPKLPVLQNTLDAFEGRITGVETIFDPVLQKADEKIKQLELQSSQLEVQGKALTAQTEDIKNVVSREITAQESNVNALIQHAKDKFNELELSQAQTVEATRTKFDEVSGLQQKMHKVICNKFQDLWPRCRPQRSRCI